MTQRLAIARALHDRCCFWTSPRRNDDRAVGILVDPSGQSMTARGPSSTTHRLDVGLRIADRVAVLAGGRIVHEADARSVDPSAFAPMYASLCGGVP
jgi:hypothetical protein